MKNKPKISIVCITYNQEKFIGQALESFVNQATNFDFEILVHDDASTDKTVEIIEKFKKGHPDIMRTEYRRENQFSKGFFGFPVKTLLQMARGEYIALCEGDDYWIDREKLQKQADFLDKNPNYSMCFHSVKVLFEDNSEKDFLYPDPKCNSNFTFEELLKLNFIQTSSVMYRKKKYDNLQTKILPFDWYLHLFHAKSGEIGYFKEIMSVYRRHSGGVWWESAKNIDNIHLKYGIQELNFYKKIYKIFSNNSDAYLQTKVLPFSRHLMNLFLVHRKFEELKELSELFPDYYDFTAQEILQRNQNMDQPRQESHGKEREIENMKRQIASMKSSKFWKLRKLYMRIKNCKH